MAINTGNRALVQQEGDQLRGISPALARRLARDIGASFQPILYDGAGKIFENVDTGVWDVAFLAIDPKRAAKVTFTRPYLTIEATYAVRANSLIAQVSDVDQKGMRVLTSAGSAYDLYLSKSLKLARLDRSGTPPESFQAFRDGSWDAVAGVRASLQQAFGSDAGYRILPDVLTKVAQAMVLPGCDHPARGALDAFVASALSDGFVTSTLQDAVTPAQ